jgi:transposase
MSSANRISREQISMISLDCLIASDNAVRIIDLFVDQLPLQVLGFKKTKAALEGRPPYEAKDMLKLYYYGYLNRVRSSPRLETECIRNVELWWLLHQLTPGYHSIADFRKDNPAALKKAFKMFVSFLKGEDVFDGKLLSADGTKLRAQNNKKNTFNDEKLVKSLAYIDSKAEEYIKELEECDAREDKQAAELKKKDVSQKLEELKERKKSYTDLQKKLKESDQKQISLIDAESRSLPIKDGITDVCYNVQAVAESKHSLIVEFETVNTTDQGQLSTITGKAMDALGVEEITVIADKGYHTGKDLQECKEKHITTVVAYPERSNKNIEPAYQTDRFIYNKEQDNYTCPQGAILTTKGKEYEKTKKGRTSYFVKRYETANCSSCPFKAFCTKANNRVIERSEYQDVIDENNRRVDENKDLYKKRQQMIEHPFGTIKRSWGYTYTLVKSLKKVNGEMAIIFTMYNLRRAMSIFGLKGLIERLKQWKAGQKAEKQRFIKHLILYKQYGHQLAA